MTEPAFERKAGERAIPIATLDTVPIIPAYIALMTRILMEHGATLRETEATPPKNVDQAAKMYLVTFPPGTVRIDGMVMHRSFPFEIRFPDGYCLQGARLSPITLRGDDPSIHALFLSEAEVKTEKKDWLSRHHQSPFSS